MFDDVENAERDSILFGFCLGVSTTAILVLGLWALAVAW